jgi:hypothetical protein
MLERLFALNPLLVIACGGSLGRDQPLFAATP